MPDRQAVTSQQTTRWTWKVTPTGHGPQTLHLTLSAHIDVAGRDAPLVVRTFDRDIQVNITILQRVSGFIQKNWPASSDSYPRLPRKTLLQTILAVAISILAPMVAHADSTTWDLNPTSGDWNTAANWTPTTVPNGPTDIATFALDPELVNGFVPAIGQSFTILGYASVTGSFSHIQNQIFDRGKKRWLLVYQSTGAALVVVNNGRQALKMTTPSIPFTRSRLSWRSRIKSRPTFF